MRKVFSYKKITRDGEIDEIIDFFEYFCEIQVQFSINDMDESSSDFSRSGVLKFPLESLEDEHFHGTNFFSCICISTMFTSMSQCIDKTLFGLFQ